MNSVITTTLKADAGQLVRGFNEAGKAAHNLHSAFGILKRPIDALVGRIRDLGKRLMMFGLGADASFATAVWAASRFQDAMANVNSILQLSHDGLQEYGRSVVSLSQQFPQSATGLAEGLYDIVSSGFEGADALNVLRQSALASSAGLTETSVASQAIVGSLNAYGQSAYHAAATSDILFQAVNLGVMTFEELAQGMGTWVGMAANIGVPLDEASAALATMTLSGIQADEASTALARTMQAFVKPSTAMKDLTQELGYESAIAMLRQEGLHGAMEKIREVTGADTEALSALFLEVRGLNGAMALTAGGGRSYNRVFEDMTNETTRAGAAHRAFDEQTKTLSASMTKFKNATQAVAIEIGNRLLPLLTHLVDIGTSVVLMWQSIPLPIRQATTFLALFGGVAASAVGYLLLTKTTTMAVIKAMSLLSGVQGFAWLNPLKFGIGAMDSLRVAVSKVFVTLVSQLPYGQQFITLVRGMGITLMGLGSALAVAAIAWYAYTQGTQDARREFQRTMDEIRSSNDELKDIVDIQKLVHDVQYAAVRAQRERNEGMSLWDQAFEMATGSAIRNIQRTREENRLWRQETEDSEQSSEKLRQGFKAIGAQAGLTANQLMRLAAAGGFDLAEAFEYLKDHTVIEFINEYGLELFQMTETTSSATTANSALAEQFALLGNAAREAGAEVITLSDRQQVLADALRAQGDTGAAFSDGLQAKEERVRAFSEAAIAYGQGTQETWAVVLDNVRLSLGEYAFLIEAANQKLIDYRDNLITVTDVLADSSYTRNQQVQITDYIEALDPEQSANLLQEIVDASASGTDTSTLDTLFDGILENLRLTSDEGVVEMDAMMELLRQSGETGGRRTADAIADAMHIGLGRLQNIAQEYGAVITGGVNPILEGLGRNPIALQGPGTTNPVPGGVDPTRNYATGGVEDHTSTLATGGPVRVWNEPELPWEAYISGSPKHRDRNKKILAEVIRRMGLDAEEFAAGGFTSGADVPYPPAGMQMGPDRPSPVGIKQYQGLKRMRDQVATWVDAQMAAQAATVAGSATGIAPFFLARWNQYNASRGNKFSITSGFRSSAQQQVLYNRWINHVPGQARAARPGSSNHERGLAIDHSPHSNASDRAAAANFKLKYPMADEPWHIEPVEALMGQLLDRMKAVKFDKGGKLPIGKTLVSNNTGKPELVLTDAQIKSMGNGRSIHIGNITVHAPTKAEAKANAKIILSEIRKLERAET